MLGLPATGQRVTATPFDTAKGQGTWQQYVVLPEEKLMAVPDSLSDETAAQFFVNPVRRPALQMLLSMRWLLLWMRVHWPERCLKLPGATAAAR